MQLDFGSVTVATSFGVSQVGMINQTSEVFMIWKTLHVT